MMTKPMMTILAVLLFMLTANTPLKAQDQDSNPKEIAQKAAEAYNWALKNYKNDIDGAIDSLESFEEDATTLLEDEKIEGKLREQIKELHGKTQKYLPAFYRKSAIRLYKQRRTDMAIDRFKEVIKVAKKYEDKKTLKKAQNLLPKLYFKSGKNAMRNMSYQSAIDNFNKALEYRENWAEVYVKKAKAYKKANNDLKMIRAIKDAVDMAKKTDDQESLNRAVRMGQTYYWQKGANAISNSENKVALDNFKKALELDKNDGYAYYYIALAKNKLLKYDEAIDKCKKALELLDKEEDKEQVAKVHLQLGIAYGSLGKQEKGCKYLKKAEQGDVATKARKEQDSFGCKYE